MSSEIAAIIVNFGTAELAAEAVESLLAHCQDQERLAIHLVDNASPGGDGEKLRHMHMARNWGERVTLWCETQNHGFGRGNNVVLNSLAASPNPPDKVFLLNPDAQLENDAVAILSRALDADPGIAAAGAAVLRPDGTKTSAAFRFPGAISEIARLVSFGPLDRLLRRFQVPLPPDFPTGKVDWVTGAAVMFRFQPIQSLGFFDPGFFLYYEEVDLMRRLNSAGWHSAYVPDARVVHVEGVATGQFSAKSERRPDPDYLYESWAYYFSRSCGRFGGLMLAIGLWPAAALNVLHRRIRGKTPSIPPRFFRDHFRLVIWPLLRGRKV